MVKANIPRGSMEKPIEKGNRNRMMLHGALLSSATTLFSSLRPIFPFL